MPSYQVVIDPPGLRFEAPDDRPLLQSALQAGADMPSSCRSGTCRTCMRRLAEGAVSYRIPWPGLTPDEKDEGWILPCVAFPASDLRIEGAPQRGWWE